jgi:hypothetical protein
MNIVCAHTMFLNERIEEFYDRFGTVANRVILVLVCLFLLGIYCLSKPVAFLLVLTGAGYYLWTRHVKRFLRNA